MTRNIYWQIKDVLVSALKPQLKTRLMQMANLDLRGINKILDICLEKQMLVKLGSSKVRYKTVKKGMKFICAVQEIERMIS